MKHVFFGLLFTTTHTNSRWGRLLALFLALSFATGGLRAQIVLSEGFEANCNPASNAFFSGCFPNWISTHGSPDNESDDQGITAYAGSKYAHGYVRYSFNCSTGTAASSNRGEGMAINYSFQAGVTYKLSYAFRTMGDIHSKEWLLTNGLPNQTGSPGFCDLTERVPARPAGSVVVDVPGNNSGWQLYEQEFMPTSNFSQLWFRAAYDNPPALDWEANGVFYMDTVRIEIICDPNSGVAAYQFEDANGNPKESFCFGEQVFLNGTDSQNETRYYIDAWRRPIGSPANTPFEWAAGLGWTVGQQVGLINLSAAFAAQGYHFEPGYEYQIKLAIADDGCIPWTEVLHEFTLECCDTYMNANFSLTLHEDQFDNYSLVVDNYQGYENLNATHEWIVLTSPNQYGGPYSQVYSTTTTGSAAFTLYEPVQPGLFYTVIHHISTICADACFGEQVYGNNFARDGDTPDAERCELCGPIDCSILKELCYAPANVSVRETFNGYRIDWDRTPNATGYTVIITVNDPDCCLGGEPYQISLSTHRNYLTLNNLHAGCFSVQVGALCGRGVLWADKVCYPPFGRPGSPDDADQALTSPVSKTQVFPNPTTNDVNIRFEAPHTGQVQLVDALGRVVAQQNTEEALNLSFDLSGQPAGFYWIIAQSGDQVQKFKIVKQ